ncbi:MAG: hypothetical protein JJW01_01505 [Alphaproteobacteria bacterium]|nr:hypothetical protein [Rickettsiales bacterium]
MDNESQREPEKNIVLDNPKDGKSASKNSAHKVKKGQYKSASNIGVEEQKIDIKNENQNTKLDTQEVSYSDERNIKGKVSVFAKLFPVQTVFFGVLGLMIIIGFGAVLTVIPLNGKKEAVLNKMRNLGIEVSINGNVYFNPFIMSFEFRKVNAKIVQTATINSSCASSIRISSANIQFKILTKEILTSGAQVFLKTDGNTSKLYDLASSLSKSGNVSGIRALDSLISISPCDIVNEKNKNINKSAEIGSLLTIPFKEAVFLTKKNSIKMFFLATIEGEKIEISYKSKGKFARDFAFNSRFANLNFKFDINENSKKSKNVGSYSANILNGLKFAKVLGFSKSATGYQVLSNGNFRTAGQIMYSSAEGLKIKNKIFTSYGNGFLNIVLPIDNNDNDKNNLTDLEQITVELHFDKIDLSEIIAVQNIMVDTSTRYLGIPSVIGGLIMRKNHKILFLADNVVSKNGEIKRIAFGYGMMNSILCPKQTFVSVKAPSFEIKSVNMENLNLPNKQSDKYQDNAKDNVSNNKNTQDDTQNNNKTEKRLNSGGNVVVQMSIIPIIVTGANICEFTNFISTLLFKNTNTQTNKSYCGNKSFNGKVNLFLDYRTKNGGFKDVDIKIANGGKIIGEHIFTVSANKNRMLESVQKINFTISQMDVLSIFPQDWAKRLFEVFKQGKSNSAVFNFTNQVAKSKNYSADLYFKDTTYNGKGLENLHVGIDKSSTQFAIRDVSGDSSIFKGELQMVFDISTVEPTLNIAADIANIDLDVLFNSNNLRDDDEKTNVNTEVAMQQVTFKEINDKLLKSSKQNDPTQHKNDNNIQTENDNKTNNNEQVGDDNVGNLQLENLNRDINKSTNEDKNHIDVVDVSLQQEAKYDSSSEKNIPDTNLKLKLEDRTDKTKAPDSNKKTEEAEEDDKGNQENKATKKPAHDRLSGVKNDTKQNQPYIFKINNLKQQIPYIDKLFGMIKIKANALKWKDGMIKNITIDCNIVNSYASITKAFMSYPEGFIDINGKVNLVEDTKFFLKGVGVGTSVKYLMRTFWGNNKVDGRVNFNILLESFGRSFANIIANLNGKISFSGKNIGITYPNFELLSDILISSASSKHVKINKVLNQPGRTNFATASGSILLQSGNIKTEDIALKSVGYSSVTKCMADLSRDQINICKSVFVLLADKPWKKDNSTQESRFLKVPISVGILDKMSEPKFAIATGRVREYFNAVEQHDSILQLARENKVKVGKKGKLYT